MSTDALFLNKIVHKIWICPGRILPVLQTFLNPAYREMVPKQSSVSKLEANTTKIQATPTGKANTDVHVKATEVTVEHSERDVEPTHVDVTKVESEATKEEGAKEDASAPGGLLQCLSQGASWGASHRHCLCQGCYFPDWTTGGAGASRVVLSLVRLPKTWS